MVATGHSVREGQIKKLLRLRELRAKRSLSEYERTRIDLSGTVKKLEKAEEQNTEAIANYSLQDRSFRELVTTGSFRIYELKSFRNPVVNAQENVKETRQSVKILSYQLEQVIRCNEIARALYLRYERKRSACADLLATFVDHDEETEEADFYRSSWKSSKAFMQRPDHPGEFY